jgi:hypothetical protein
MRNLANLAFGFFGHKIVHGLDVRIAMLPITQIAWCDKGLNVTPVRNIQPK